MMKVGSTLFIGMVGIGVVEGIGMENQYSFTDGYDEGNGLGS
jgi:hypothetical protein